MAISDCTNCWDTPCTCGWDYRNWSIKRLENQINVLSKVLNFKKENPNAKFSDFEGNTRGDRNLRNYLNEKKV